MTRLVIMIFGVLALAACQPGGGYGNSNTAYESDGYSESDY